MRFQLWREQRCLVEIELDQPIELGRQKIGEPDPFHVENKDGVYRCVVAHHSENTVSRSQLRIERGATHLVLSNLNTRRDLELPGFLSIAPGESASVELNTEFRFLDFTVKIANQVTYQSLPNQTLAPGQLSGLHGAIPSLPSNAIQDTRLSQSKLIEWLSQAILVFQDAATSPRFLKKAVQAVREIVNLSTAAVLLLEDGKWVTKASSSEGAPSDLWVPSQTIIDLVLAEKRTFFNLCEQAAAAQSLMGVKAIVASPILSGDNEVIGILYGDRRTRSGSPVEEIEAVLVEVLATGVAAGLARVEQEGKAIRARADFQRSFGRELSEHLEANPEMLAGRIEEITIMFCDVTGFSSVSEKLGPEKTMSWIGQVMGELHEVVIANQGVVIDYVGDELIAMWGAPVKQDNHAILACETALAISEKLTRANRERLFLTPATVRIGINTGLAHVGDTGTRYRTKYGAMGDTVNLASRIQGATKFFGCDFLISSSTRHQLGDSFPCRRLGKVKVVNIKRPIELFELLTPSSDDHIQSEYEKALACMESGEFDSATGMIEKLAAEFPTDAPTQALKKRIGEIKTVKSNQSSDTRTDLIWELPNK